MSATRRFFFAGLGALAPVAVSFLSLDARALFSDITVIVFLGYATRDALLFVIGGAIGYFHETETSPWKLFQLGIAGPALITTFLNGAASGGVKTSLLVRPLIDASVVAPLYAGEISNYDADRRMTSYACPNEDPLKLHHVRFFERPDETKAEQYARGLVNANREDLYVVLGVYESSLEALSASCESEAKFELYSRKESDAPEPHWHYYLISDAHLSRDDAEKAKDDRVHEGHAGASVFDPWSEAKKD